MLLCFHLNLFKVCCCVFHWNAFDIYIQLLSDYTLICFIETKLRKDTIPCMVKHRPLMYEKNMKRKLLKYCVLK